jgi:hypothetical protein
MRKEDTARFVVCLTNRNYRASLVVRRLYKVIPDPEAAAHGLLRIVDESGEDYLYPEGMFAAVQLSDGVMRRLSVAA